MLFLQEKKQKTKLISTQTEKGDLFESFII
jgi:hypothetical protein